jgi:hypothetical protein
MKIIKIFSIFIVLHLTAWSAAHFYLSKNTTEILLVVDTSYAMRPKFSAIKQWIITLENKSRYKKIIIGTDKALLGELSQLKSKDIIFRAAFGRLHPDNLNRYIGMNPNKKILLSDGNIQPKGWQVVNF